jgi:hypothetical protein
VLKVLAIIGLLFASYTFALATPPQENSDNASSQVTRGVRNEIFRQLMASYPEMRECVRSDAGGEDAARERLSVTPLDLNKDGRPEFEVELGGPCVCGEHNCSIWIFRKAGDEYDQIFEGDGFGLTALKTSTNGYKDLRIGAHDSAAVEARTYYKFNGRVYSEFRSELVNHETGERKPAQRRVRFATGSSSATVRGKASLGFPDIYRVRARWTKDDAAARVGAKGGQLYRNESTFNGARAWPCTQLERGA